MIKTGPDLNVKPKEDIDSPPMDNLRHFSCFRNLEPTAVQRGWASEVAAWQCWRTWQTNPTASFCLSIC